MKKFLLFLMMLVAVLTATAQEVTGNAMDKFGAATISNISEFNVAPVTLTFAKNGGSTDPAYNKAGDCRIYAKNTITAACTTGNLTKIVFTISAQGKKRLTDLTPSVGTVTIAEDHSTITWEGNATEVVMTVGEKAVYGTDGDSKAGQICFTEFTATYEAGSVTAAAAPSLPADCSFTESKTIEITNNEEGATVYYTTDGENFNEYVGEFTINETTTVRAYAQIGDDVATKSFEVERTYTKLEAKTIAEVIEAGVGEAYTKGTVVATYAKGFLLNDETGYILVYQGNAPTVAEGDVININGTTSMYGGLLQFATGANIEKTGTAEVTHPEAVVMDGAAFDAFLTAPEVKYVEYIGTLTINGNYYNVAVEGAETAIASIQYPNDGLVTVESGEVIKVTGYTIGYNKSFVNTMAVKVEAYVEPTPEPEPEPAAAQYRVKTEAGYLNIGNTDEHATGPIGGVNVVAYAEDNNQIFTLEDAGDGNYYLKSASGYYVFCQTWNVDGLTEKKTALTFEKVDESNFYIKHVGGYFKVQEVDGIYYPFCDAPIGDAATWSLEQVGAVEPEPEPEPEPEVTVEIDATKEYYLKSSWNYGLNSGYLTLGDKSGANYGHAYMANESSQAFKFTLVEDGANKYYTLSTEITGTMSYTAYVDCSHASNVNSNAMVGSNLLLELENATSSKYVVKTANGYLKADMVSYGTDGSAYHVFSNGDRESALVFELVEKADAPEVAAPVITAITPADGAEVTSLSEVVLTFDKAIKEVDTMNGIIKVKTAGSTSRAYGHAATISDDGLTVTFPIGDDMGGFKTIDAEGEYTIEIPAGVVTSTDGAKNEAATSTFTIVAATEPEPEKPETFTVTAALFPTVEGDVTEIKDIRVEAGQGPSLADLPTAWTLTNEAGDEFTMNIDWLNFCEDIIITVNPAITEAGTYTLTIPAGSLKTEDGKECEAATFSWTVVGPVDPYMPYNNGKRTRTDRLIKGITLTGASGENSYALTADEQTQDYTDATAVVFKVEAGEELTITFDKIGEWIHQFVFIDFDGDGFTASIEAGSSYAPAEDLVAYSFYNNDSSSDEYGWNSVGTSITGKDRSTPAVPAFKAPETIGTYRMRVKQDWCNIDPAGDADGKFDDFKANGGQIIDVTLEVVEGTTGIENIEAETINAIYDITGRKVEKITEGGIYIVNGKKVLVK